MTTREEDNREKHRKRIVFEFENANREKRDFRFSREVKRALREQYGAEVVCAVLIQEIRRTNMPCIEPFDPLRNMSKFIEQIIRGAGNISVAWFHLIENGVSHRYHGMLFDKHKAGSTFSTLLNGDERMHTKIGTARTPVDNWTNDVQITKSIMNNITKDEKAPLSRNRIRTNCMMTNGCRYPTAFPIDVALAIYKHEARGRVHPVIVLDPCAGWGDRLAAALIAGPSIVERFVAIDPWSVSNSLCERIQHTLDPTGSVNVQIRSEPAQAGGWPDADVIFTSPPYAMLECYNYDGSNSDTDQQAWRLCKENKFVSHFLVPLMRNAAEATRKRNGRVIININNTNRRAAGTQLTQQIKEAAKQAGLQLVEVWGMTLSKRMTDKSNGKRIEPIFVFAHGP